MKTGLNFQTCTIINSNDYQGKKLFETVNDVFRVRPNMNFEKSNITKLYTAAGYEGVNEVVTVDFSKVITEALTANKYYRLDIYLKVIGAEPFIYSTPWVQKGHPFWCDFVAKKGLTADEVAAALAKSMKKDLIFQMGEELLVASASTSTLTLTVQHDYLRFAKVVLVELNEEGDDTEVVASLEDNTTIKKTAEGKNAFGTYSYIIQNLRLPTTENLRWTHLHDDETPIVGGIYDLFILEYTAPANNRPLGAVGCEVQSHTLHSFWVLHSLADAFKAELNKAAGDGIALQSNDKVVVNKVSELNTKTGK